MFREKVYFHFHTHSFQLHCRQIFHLTKLLKLSQRTVVVVKSCPDTTSSSPPSALHQQLVSLERAGLVQTAIAMDHWALLQKAGFPQHKVIELVGSMFDPSNPPHGVEEERRVTSQTVKCLLEREVSSQSSVVCSQ